MVSDTMIRRLASVPSEEEAITHDALDPPTGEPGSPRAIEEPPIPDPVELLIKEARRRARRRRLVVGGLAVATVAVAAIAGTASLDEAVPTQGQGTALDAPAGTTALGVFEPMRGRIVYVAGRELRAVDPDEPTSVHELALPDEVRGAFLMAAGWSADGTRLALSSEHSGRSYVMAADGEVTAVEGGGGCCWFVVDPWLSPDGTSVLDLVAGDQLRVSEFGSGEVSRMVRLQPPVGDLDTGIVPIEAWSPDGARVAYTAYEQVGAALLPSVHVVDLDTGATWQVVRPGFGHVRHMTWSPDGSRLLVIAGPWRLTTEATTLNPLVHPHETALYLVDPQVATTRTPDPIASGHFIAATWSPDGGRIAAIEYDGSSRRMIVLGADGSAYREVLNLPHGGLFSGLAWHPAPDAG